MGRLPSQHASFIWDAAGSGLQAPRFIDTFGGHVLPDEDVYELP